MKIEDQIAQGVLDGDWKGGYEIPPIVAKELGRRIAAAIRKDRERAARIVTMAPLDMSLEQLAILILGG